MGDHFTDKASLNRSDLCHYFHSQVILSVDQYNQYCTQMYQLAFATKKIPQIDLYNYVVNHMVVSWAAFLCESGSSLLGLCICGPYSTMTTLRVGMQWVRLHGPSFSKLLPWAWLHAGLKSKPQHSSVWWWLPRGSWCPISQSKPQSQVRFKRC